MLPGDLRCDPSCESLERQALQQDDTGSPKRGRKHSHTPEHHRLEAACPLDIELDAIGECHYRPGIHPQYLSIQFLLNHVSTGMQERDPLPLQLFEHKPVATKKSRTQLLLERNSHARSP